MAHNFTPGPWAWYQLGGKLTLCADYGKRKVILCDRKGKLNTCDPDREASYLIDAVGHEPDMRLLTAAPDYFDGVAQMLLNEDSGGDGWWKGWEMLKAAHAKAQGNRPQGVA